MLPIHCTDPIVTFNGDPSYVSTEDPVGPLRLEFYFFPSLDMGVGQHPVSLLRDVLCDPYLLVDGAFIPLLCIIHGGLHLGDWLL